MKDVVDLHGEGLAQYWSLRLQQKFLSLLPEGEAKSELQKELTDQMNAILSKD